MTVLVQCLRPESNQSSSSSFFFLSAFKTICGFVVEWWSWPLLGVPRDLTPLEHLDTHLKFACFVFLMGSLPLGGVRSQTPWFGVRLSWAAAISFFMQTRHDPLGAPG